MGAYNPNKLTVNHQAFKQFNMQINNIEMGGETEIELNVFGKDEPIGDNEVEELKTEEKSEQPTQQKQKGYYFPSVKKKRLIFAIIVAVIVFLIDFFHPIFGSEFAGRCFALLILVSILWSTNAIPLYITSLMIPPLVVWLRILPDPIDPTKALDAISATQDISHNFWSSTIFLFLGGFTIAKAVELYDLNKFIATLVLSKIGRRTFVISFVIMILCAFLSMWISNPAASVLCLSVLLPVIRQLPPNSREANMLLMSIAFGGNIGGISTPIASPQNAIALSVLSDVGTPVSFLKFLLFSLPICIFGIPFAFFMLWILIRPKEKYLPEIPLIKIEMKFVHYFITLIISITIILWFLNDFISSYTGGIGIISLIPVIAFFGTGYLKVTDFDAMSWNTLMLVCGGLSLGYAVEQSLLLEIVTEFLASVLQHSNIWVVQLVFNSLLLLLSTFISHTVASIIVLPIVANYGLSVGHPGLLVLSSVFMCSGSMSLPVSSFPNANSYSVKNPKNGKSLLKISMFLKGGIVVGIFVLVFLQSIFFFEASLFGL